MNKKKFVKLTVVAGDRTLPVWFRIDLIVRFNVGWDNKTHMDYMGGGFNAPIEDYIIKESPEEISARIELL